VIVGAYLYDNGETNEGRAYVYHGSASGLNTTAAWTGESNQVGAAYGASVSTAGDVNGDGFSDVIVGAYGYDNGETNEGRAYVYHGSASGLSPTAAWTGESNQVGAQYGFSVSTAGDVNGDGFSDVIVGAYLYDNGETNEGRAYVYHGSASGLNTTAAWVTESNQANAEYGRSVSTAGDVNGDGYSDVIVGAYLYDNGETNEGAAFVYYGNSSTGIRSTLQQYQVGSSNIIGPHGRVTTDDQIRFSLFAKSPYGRTRGRLVYEYKATGDAFSGNPITNSTQSTGQGSFTSLGTTGTTLNHDVTGIPVFDNYRWRVRVKYDIVSNPYQVYGPWRYYENYQPMSFGSFKSKDQPLPVSLLAFNYSVNGRDVRLSWTTEWELNNAGFDIERKRKSEAQWTKIGFVEGSGTTNQPRSYSYEDKMLSKGVYEYRLKQIDYCGQHEYHQLYSDVIIGAPSRYDLSQNYPNPSNPNSKINFSIPIDSRVTLKIYDVTGREVKTLLNSEYKEADYYTIEFDGTDLASGVYFYRIVAEGLEGQKFTKTMKLVLIK
jgi:hypothetical protein